jgi:hypothetical protein
MKVLKAFFLFTVFYCCPALINAQQPVSDRLSFSIDPAPWVMTLPAAYVEVTEEKISSDGKLGYFAMKNYKSGIMVSFIIESANKCKDSASCRDLVYDFNMPLVKEPKKVKKYEIDQVAVYEYFMPSSEGVPVKQQNLYAEFVQDGFWVDMHISKSVYDPKEHDLLEEVVRSVKFEKKPVDWKMPSPPSPDQLSDARVAQTAWMALLDEGKYEECWTNLALSSKESKTMPHDTWIIYISGIRKPLGKVKERLPLKQEIINSLQNATDQKGAIISFKSSFENKKEIVETFALIQEKSGEWKVKFYITKE